MFDAVIAGKAKMAKFLDDAKRQPRHWTGEASDDGEWKTGWFYAVPLDELISVEAVQALIVAPVHAILRGADIDATLAKIEDRLCLPPQA